MPDDLTNPCCKCTTPQYSIYLNTQGPPGKQGEQGFPGVSPVVTVAVQTDTTYKLNITDANGTITTPNLQGRGVPRGGEIGDILVKTGSADYDATWQDAYLNMPLATATTPGIVQPDNVTTTVSGGVLSAHLAVNFQEPLSMKYKYYGLPEYLNTYNSLIAGNNLATTDFVPYAINNESSTGANAIFFPSNWVTEDGTGWQLPVDSGRSYMVVRNFNSGDTIHTPLTYADLSQLYGACIVWGNYNSNTGVFIPKLCYVPIYTYSNEIGTTTNNAVLTNTRTHYFATIGSDLNNLNLTTLFTDSTTSAATYALNNIQLTEVDNSVEVRAFNDGQTIVKTGELDNSFQSYNINAVLLNIPKTLNIDPGSPITTLTGAIEADDLYITNAIGEKVWEVDYSTANTEVALDIGNGLTLDSEGKLAANIDNNTITFGTNGELIATGGGGGTSFTPTEPIKYIPGSQQQTGFITSDGYYFLNANNTISNDTAYSQIEANISNIDKIYLTCSGTNDASITIDGNGNLLIPEGYNYYRSSTPASITIPIGNSVLLTTYSTGITQRPLFYIGFTSTSISVGNITNVISDYNTTNGYSLTSINNVTNVDAGTTFTTCTVSISGTSITITGQQANGTPKSQTYTMTGVARFAYPSIPKIRSQEAAEAASTQGVLATGSGWVINGTTPTFTVSTVEGEYLGLNYDTTLYVNNQGQLSVAVDGSSIFINEAGSLSTSAASDIEELGNEVNQLAGDVTSLTTTVGQKVNYTDLTNYYTKKEADAAFATQDDLNTKIDTAELDTYIQAGTNVSISKSGNILTISATGGGGGEGGTTDYTQLTNKPQINNVELSGNKTLDELGIQAKGNYAISTTGLKLWTGTQTEYDAITSKDDNTLYFITGT